MKGLEKFQNLVDALMQLPSVGKKSATGFAYLSFTMLSLSKALYDRVKVKT
jgi:recombinational DNA repair protein RecR